MIEKASPKVKTFSFGGCDIGMTSPALEAITPNTQVLNITWPLANASARSTRTIEA